MLDTVPTSITGYKKLRKELERLEKEAEEVRQRVAEAREQGDLKENGAYIYGRQELGMLEGRMGQLRTKINCSEQVDCTKVSCERVVFGTVVTLLDLNTQKKVKYQLLGPHDADLDNGSISYLTPIGKAIEGLSVGEQASGTIPRGEFRYEVIDIAASEIE